MIIGTAIVGLTALPVRAAERVYFSYGVLERSVAVSSLEAYAEDGTVNSDLAFFLRFLDEDVRDEFRTALDLLGNKR